MAMAAVVLEGVVKQLKELIVLCSDMCFGRLIQVYLCLCRTRGGQQLLKLSFNGCAACSCT